MDPQIESVAEDFPKVRGRPGGVQARRPKRARRRAPLRRVTRGPGEGQYRGNGN
jgi:hypothetical protein